MVEHGAPKFSMAAGSDYEQHEETYKDFLALTKWVVIAVTFILILMFVFLT